MDRCPASSLSSLASSLPTRLQRPHPQASREIASSGLDPAVLICCTITLLVIAVMGGLNRGLILPAIASFLLSPYGAQIDGSYWTLGIEIVFYLLIFVLLVSHRFQYLQPVMMTVAAFSIAFHICIYALQQHLIPNSPIGTLLTNFFETRTAQLVLIRHGAIFALGVFLWLCMLHRWTPGRAIALAFCCSAACSPSGPIGSRSSTPTEVLPLPCPQPRLADLARLHHRFNSGNHKITQFVGPRGARAARILGLLTYPLYLLHQRAGDAFLIALHGRMPDTVALVLVVALLVALSFIIVLYLEKPIQAQFRRLLHDRTKSIQTPAASLP